MEVSQVAADMLAAPASCAAQALGGVGSYRSTEPAPSLMSQSSGSPVPAQTKQLK
ncbi:hypothetical protein P7K49_033975, partial [Saguinus oedipus]